MPEKRDSRAPAVCRGALVCTMALTLLVARASAVNVVPTSSSLKAAVHCQSARLKQQCVEQGSGFEFNVVPRTFPVFRPLLSFLYRGPADQAPPLFLPDDTYHNRPPPLS